MAHSEIEVGEVVMVPTGQAGTVIGFGPEDAAVLLANGDIWYGHYNTIWRPTSQEELDQAPLNVDRFKNR